MKKDLDIASQTDKHKLPEYSVLMSVYKNDNAVWLEEAFYSMLNQSFSPKEIVLVKDGPLTDALNEMIDRLCQLHSSVLRVFTLDKNFGLGLAMQFGVEQCQCEWIARMDADDISDLNRCEIEMNAALQNNADIVGCDCDEFIDTVSNVASRRLFPESHQELVKFSKHRTPFCHPAVMMKKSAVMSAGNYRHEPFVEDYDLFVRMLASGARGFTVKKILYHVRTSREFYGRRGGMQYLVLLLRHNVELYQSGWTSLYDLLYRSAGNCVGCLVPSKVRIWIYKRILRK